MPVSYRLRVEREITFDCEEHRARMEKDLLGERCDLRYFEAIEQAPDFSRWVTRRAWRR